MVCAFYERLETMPYYLSIVYKSSLESETQVFFNTGDGYNEEQSVTYPIFTSNSFEELIFPMPTKEILNIRIDPLIKSGTLEIERIVVKGRKKNHGKFEFFHDFDLKSLVPTKDVSISYNSSGNIIINSPLDAKDSILEIPMKKSLNHWNFEDFLDREWLSQSAFLALLIAPVIISLSLKKATSQPSPTTIKFKYKKKNIGLKEGEQFSPRDLSLCYRDTSTENLKTIINEIKLGTHWKKAVKEKFQEANPWLYEIVTSPKRTKFLDEFIKPNNLQILDIGAGWGQLTLPLAKQNKICSLEPTPERLDFITAAANQENVSKNISFIGADYLDIKFENEFDLILSIGVLEWVGAFRSGKEPEELQLEFLKKIKSELKEDGKLIIGIENRLGLKYLMGAPDDHIGHPNITIHQKEIAKKLYKEKTDQELRSLTHSMPEYKEMLLNAEFNNISFYTSNPDYKLPVKIFKINDNECELNKYILNKKWIEEHDGTNGKTLDNQNEIKSMAKSIAELKTLHNFAPSFFIVAN